MYFKLDIGCPSLSTRVCAKVKGLLRLTEVKVNSLQKRSFFKTLYLICGSVSGKCKTEIVLVKVKGHWNHRGQSLKPCTHNKSKCKALSNSSCTLLAQPQDVSLLGLILFLCIAIICVTASRRRSKHLNFFYCQFGGDVNTLKLCFVSLRCFCVSKVHSSNMASLQH